MNGFTPNNTSEIINSEALNIKCLAKREIIMISTDHLALIWNTALEDKMLPSILVTSIKLLSYEKARKLGLNL